VGFVFETRALGSGIKARPKTFKSDVLKEHKVLGALQSGPLKLGSNKFNIIINIQNMIICIINILIFYYN
jgi:hypothetical protein